MVEALPIAKGKQVDGLLPSMANRHGLIAGATGTGKTVILRVMAENLSRLGVPIFMADVKGDLSGIAHLGKKLQRSVSGSNSWTSTILFFQGTRRFIGIFTARRVTRSARRSPRRARY